MKILECSLLNKTLDRSHNNQFTVASAYLKTLISKTKHQFGV